MISNTNCNASGSSGWFLRMAVQRTANRLSVMRLRLMEKFAMSPVALVMVSAKCISSIRIIRSASGSRLTV